MRVAISERGAALVSWWAPDRDGQLADVLLGYPEADAGPSPSYARNDGYFGAVVGRWANRIAGAAFTLDGVRYLVDCNSGRNHLHGGASGFHLAHWHTNRDGDRLRLRLRSADGDAGFPGNLEVEVCYRLFDDGRLVIDYAARSDAPTPINLTSHPYFNLNGGSAGIGDHLLAIDADCYLTVDQHLIPVGMALVAGTAFDFRQPAAIGAHLAWPDAQLVLAGGFDHCYCLRPLADAKTLREVARVHDPGSGRRLSVATTEAGLQFYSGNFLQGVQGRADGPYAIHDGFCLEAQVYPDQINGPDAELAVLRPGQIYHQRTVYRIDVAA
jgi:aldose 1-epimerase